MSHLLLKPNPDKPKRIATRYQDTNNKYFVCFVYFVVKKIKL